MQLRMNIKKSIGAGGGGVSPGDPRVDERNRPDKREENADKKGRRVKKNKHKNAGNLEERFEATPATERAVRRFQTVVGREPRQGLRYDWGGEAFWPSAHPPPGASPQRPPPRCPGCGAARRFELQLMPALLFALRVDDHAALAAAQRPTACEVGYTANGIGRILSSPAVPTAPGHTPVLDATGTDEGSKDKRASQCGLTADLQRAALQQRGRLAATASLPKSKAPIATATARLVTPTTPMGMDWGAVAVFSCEMSCALSEEEHVAVNPPIE
jgi:hypothetical protein